MRFHISIYLQPQKEQIVTGTILLKHFKYLTSTLNSSSLSTTKRLLQHQTEGPGLVCHHAAAEVGCSSSAQPVQILLNSWRDLPRKRVACPV